MKVNAIVNQLKNMKSKNKSLNGVSYLQKYFSLFVR